MTNSPALRPVRTALALLLVLAGTACGGSDATTGTTGGSTGGGTGGGSTGGSTGGGTTTTLVLTSGAESNGGVLSTTYTCDGASKSPPLSWTGVPAGVAGYAMVMTTIPGPGTVKYNWLLYNLPASATAIAENTNGGGTAGFADDGGGLNYAPPARRAQGPSSTSSRCTHSRRRRISPGCPPIRSRGRR